MSGQMPSGFAGPLSGGRGGGNALADRVVGRWWRCDHVSLHALPEVRRQAATAHGQIDGRRGASLLAARYPVMRSVRGNRLSVQRRVCVQQPVPIVHAVVPGRHVRLALELQVSREPG